MRAARHFVLSALPDWSGQAREVVALLTSELVTNVIVHTGPHRADENMVVGVTGMPGGVRVEVSDRSTDVPVVARRDLDGLSGRGLLLVDALAAAWGVVAAERSKVVWFEVKT